MMAPMVAIHTDTEEWVSLRAVGMMKARYVVCGSECCSLRVGTGTRPSVGCSQLAGRRLEVGQKSPGVVAKWGYWPRR
jgi:hypothetical protein